MSVYDDMARDAGYVGDQAEQMARTLEEQHRDVCEYDGHEWAPAGGGLLVCMRCETESWASEHDAYHLDAMSGEDARP